MDPNSIHRAQRVFTTHSSQDWILWWLTRISYKWCQWVCIYCFYKETITRWNEACCRWGEWLSTTLLVVVNWLQIQYAKRQRYQPKQPIYCPFLKCHVNKLTWKCSGILACEFLNPYLKSYQHTSVDDHIWELIQKSMDDAKLIESNESRRHAYR